MFISVEGIEGAGKSSQAQLLANWLKERGVNVLLTKEPGSIISKECQQIRRLILDPENNISAKSEFFLYLADRAQHVDKCIRPALESNVWVISDRYVDSTKVYQGIGRDLGLAKVAPMIEYASSGLMPDIVFVLDIDAKLGIGRARSSNVEFAGGDRMEREHISFHEKLRKGFLDIAQLHNRYVVINADKTIEELHREITEIVGRLV